MKKPFEINFSETEIIRYLKKTNTEFRYKDPAYYLYKILVDDRKNLKNFNEKFIELCYVTLCAWNMNSRGAKLADWSEFKTSFIKLSNYEIFNSYRLESISEKKLSDLFEIQINQIFEKLKFVEVGKPKLVTYSKILHFCYPKLFVPIDRKYILTFFDLQVPKTIKYQSVRYKDLMLIFHKFASNNNLQKYEDNLWNTSVSKIIDNLIIGFTLCNR